MGQMKSAGYPFSKRFESANQTITLAGLTTIAHGLGVVPRLIQIILVCTTAEHNYSIGDEISHAWTSSLNAYGVIVVPDSVNLICRTGGSDLRVFDKTTGLGIAITAANWRFKVRAFA